MDRSEFETLRDLPGKRIVGDVRLAGRQSEYPLVTARIVIENSMNVALFMTISMNLETGGKTINVHIGGAAAICRLDVDGPMHGPAGRSHKHSLLKDRCLRRNLRDDVAPRPELAGRPIEELFQLFCTAAKILHDGSFFLSGKS